MRTIVFYISGHGFGHAARDIEVINSILQRRHDVRVIVRTSAPQWLFDRTVRSPHADRFTRVEDDTDTGVVQIDSLTLDEAHTVARARTFMQTLALRADAEAGFLRQHRAHLVVADIPPLGIAAATKAGLPAVALGNFTWDWIYAAYPGGDDIAAAIGDVYAEAACALRLPMHGGFATFPCIIDIPFVARRSARDPVETRRALGLPLEQRVVLISFGGYGLDRIQQDTLAGLHGYFVLGSAAHPLDEDAMYDGGLRYEDVVRAADVVITKPGYGIISECIANDTAILYTSRGHFVEYDVLVAEMPRYMRAQFIDHQTLFAGDWQDSLDALLRQPLPAGRTAVNGADVAAGLLLDMI